MFNREADALAHLLALLELESAILAWDPADIPLADLSEGLRRKGVRVVSGDPDVRIGLTGVDAGLASTGSLVLCSGTGKPRLASLLPPVHIAVLTAEQLFPGLEAWLAAMSAGGLEQLGTISTLSVISGPSRTGDIGNIPVRGVHGPGEVMCCLSRLNSTNRSPNGRSLSQIPAAGVAPPGSRLRMAEPFVDRVGLDSQTPLLVRNARQFDVDLVGCCARGPIDVRKRDPDNPHRRQQPGKQAHDRIK